MSGATDGVSYRSRHGWPARAVALALSWVIPATTAWSAAPLERTASPISVPLPRLSAPAPLEPSGPLVPGIPDLASALAPMQPGWTSDPGWTAERGWMGEPGAPVQTTPPPPPASACDASFFGPLRFVRTSGPKNEYVRTVSVPSWIVSPFHLRIQNGEPNGTYRVSSATVHVNGVQVAGTSEFNQNVATLDRLVTLTPTTTLKVVLASKPTSYLTINLCGANADHTAPRLAWTAPLTGTAVNDATPALSLSYEDLVGTGEPGASGVDLASLAVTLDGVDRTALFMRRATDASAELPPALALAEGTHQVVATLKDVAGNSVQAVSDFVVDLTPPTIQVVDPPRGAYLPTLEPVVRVTFADNLGLDRPTLEVLVDGENRTPSFQDVPGGVTATLSLSSGPHEVVARIRDKGGNAAVPAATSFNLDTTPPVVTIAQPRSESRHGTRSVEAIVSYRDDQALDVATFAATLDGQPVTLGTPGPEGAMAFLSGLADGAHTLTASIRDRAGNPQATQAQFWVDTTVPAVRVVMPPPGHPVATLTPTVVVEYSDEQGLDRGTFRLRIDGVEVPCDTSGDDAATCHVPTPLAQGEHAVAAEVRDTTGNLGTAASTFTVDTLAPTGAMVAPGPITDTAVPAINFDYSDGGTGVVVDSVAVLIDGVDRTALFARTATGAAGAPDQPLADGVHQVVITLEDAAGNEATITGSFTVDTTKPTASITSPAAFVNDATPAVRVAYGDGAGTGVAGAGSVRVFHRRGDDPETEITSLFQVGPEEATAAALPALADGTHHLRVEVADRAGNVGHAAGVFVLDTVPPTYAVVSPAADAFLSSPTPAIVIRYDDDRSGVDTGTLALQVDAAELTARLPPERGPNETTAVLLASDALADGRHIVTVRLSDRAGNAATLVPHAFVVDTVAPQVTSLVPAHQGYFDAVQGLVRATYTDADTGAGNGVGQVDLVIDGVDRSPELSVPPDQAQIQLVTTLGEGEHTVEVTVYDWANNRASATSTFVVDLTAPVVSLTPATGVAGREPAVEVTGTLTDADPQTSVECRRGGATFPATLAGEGLARTFSCTVELEEGENSVVAVARDRFGREGTSEARRLVLDRVAPEVVITEPLSGVCTSAFSVTVTGTVSDASLGPESSVDVTVAGVAASCTANGAGTCTFSATVPVGAGPQATLAATATDAAQNAATTSVTLCVDRDLPAVVIDTPAPGTYHRGPTLAVGGTVSDPTSPAEVEVAGVREAAPNPALSRRFEVLVPVADGAVGLVATATDAAGNSTVSPPVVVNVDSVPPVVTFSAPATGTVTRASSVLVTGEVQDASPVTLSHAGQAVPLDGGRFSLLVPLPAEGQVPIAFLARDAAGNETAAAVEVTVDRQAPELTIVFPVPGQANVVGALPLVVQGLVQDATDTVVTVSAPGLTAVTAERTLGAWQAAFAALADGPYEFTATATDAAGNTVSKTVKVFVDLVAPQVTITSPASGTLTNQPGLTVTGTVQETGRVSVLVAGVAASVQRVSTDQWSFSATVVLPEGQQAIVAMATDGSGRTGDATVSVTADFTPPTVTLTTPTQVSRGKPGQAVAVVMDGDVASITVRWGGAEITCATSPCTLPLTVPEGTASGTTIVAQASATDLAQNTGTAAPRGVTVVADGVVTGQVLSDATGLVLPGASVRMVAGSGEVTTTSDEEGRYSLPTGEANAVVVVSLDLHTTVERDLAVVSGTGTVPVDARLTPLGPDTAMGAEETTLRVPLAPAPPSARQPAIAVTFAAGAVPEGTSARLTALSAQGLPGLLPLGWAPVAAFDLRLSEPPSAALPATVTFADGSAPAGTLQLVAYDAPPHAWRLVVRDVAAGPTVRVTLLQAGAYALVAADEADIAVPAAGETLTGVEMVPLPPTATSSGSVSPSAIAPTGGTARGSLQVQSTTALPSGTVVQAEVHESYTLRETDSAGLNVVASTAKRRQDIVLFRLAGGAAGSAPPLASPTTLSAEIPITPSRTYGRADIVRGEVVLDILAGREGVRGAVGGSAAVDLVAGDVRLTVPAGALAEDTALSVEIPSEPSAFLPSLAGLEPVAEVWLDFSGHTLGSAATLSVPPGSIQAGDTILIARIERALTASVPRPVVVALGILQGDRVVTVPHPALPGIVEGGQYAVNRSGPVGFVRGTVVAGGSPARALIEPVLASAWPFVAVSGGDGAFTLTVPPGPAQVRASVPNTPYAGSASVTVAEGEVTPLTLALAGTATTLSITPPDGTVAVPVNVPFQVQSSTPLRPETVTSESIRLFKGPVELNQAVAVQVLLAQDRRTISVVPVPPPLPPEAPPDAPGLPALAFETTYTLQVAGLQDVFGSGVAEAISTFLTKDDAPLPIDLKKLVLSVPDASGLVTITAPAGTLVPGSTILVINSGNGFVLTLTAGNDGEVNGVLEASVSDRLLVTITDPNGHTTSFEKSQFFDAATGATVVGAGGGVIEGPNGEELRIPEGALDKPVKLRVTAATEAEYAAAFEGDTSRPSVTTTHEGQVVTAHFGRALKIEASDETAFKKEVDLAFPLPDFSALPEDQRPPKPEDAFYQVYRRIEGPCRDGASECPVADRQIFYEAIDNAFVEGEGANRKLVTASYPWTGYKYGWSRWDPIAGAGFDGLGGAVGGSAIGNVAASWAILMWTYTALLPGASVNGVITGKVLRPVFKAGQTDPVYEGVSGVMVQRDDQADPSATVAFTGGGGEFTFHDPHFKGGFVEVRADYAGQTYRSTAFAVERSDTKILSDPQLGPLLRGGFFRNIATANITLPPSTAPPPAPDFGIHVMRVTDGRRAEVSSAVAGTGLVIGFRSPEATVTSATVNGQAKNVVTETAPPPVLPMDYLLQDPGASDGRFTPSQAGSYTVTATALPPFGPPVTEQKVFRVLAAGGAGTVALPGRPGVIAVTPKDDLQGLPIDVFPTVTFSEPVTNVLGNVSLVPSSGPAPTLKLAGVGVNSEGDTVALETITPTSRVTSLTIEPVGGLKYGEAYTLTLTDAIEDLDKGPDGEPLPSKLIPFTSAFATFRPEPIGASADQTELVGLGVMDDRAYALETEYTGGTGATYQNGILRVYDISDPAQPRNIPPGARIAYPPRDLAVLKRVTTDAFGNESAQKLVALAAGSRTFYQLQGELIYYHEIVSTPTNVFIYNVDDDGNPREVGAVSLTQNILDGYPWRITMDGNSLFAATARKGIQVVSLASAMDGYEDEMRVPADMVKARRALFSGGYRMHAVVQTIPMLPVEGVSSSVLLNLYDLKVGHVQIDGTAARLVFATGSSPAVAFVMVNPDTTERVYQGRLEGGGGSITWGNAIAFAPVAGRDLVLVGGIGTAGGAGGNVVGVVDVSNPRAFQVLGWVKVPHTVGDIIIKEATAIVSGDRGSRAPDGTPGVATLINLADPTNPFVSGTLVGVGSRMALAPNNILLSTERDFLKGNPTALSGVKTATLGRIAIIERVEPRRVVLDQANKAAEPVKVRFKVVPPPNENQNGRLELVTGDTAYASQSVVVPTGTGVGTHVLPAGTDLSKPTPELRLVVDPGGEDELVGFPRRVETSAAAVEPAEVMEVSADERSVPITVYSDSHVERSLAAIEGGSPRDATSVTFEVAGGGSISPNPVAGRGGTFESTLSISTTADATHQVSARLPGSDVVKRSALITVVPGKAKDVALVADRTSLPADEASETTLTLTAKDQFGNTVADGTAVIWGVEGKGTLAALTTPVTGGVATVKFRAGDVAGEPVVVARIDDAEARLPITLETVQVTVEPAMTTIVSTSRAPIPVTITATSAAGPPADSAELVFQATLGRVEAPAGLSGGRAVATFTPVGAIGDARLMAAVSTHLGEATVALTPPPGFHLRPAQLVLVGDQTEDGTVEVEDIEGNLKSVPYRTSTTVTVRGNPGDVVDLKLGGLRSPNVEPIAWYTMDEIETGGAVTDEYHDHPAVAEGATLDYQRRSTGEASLRFEGEARVTVQDHIAFSPPAGLGLATDFRAESTEGVLVSKAGAWGLSLFPAGEDEVGVRAFVTTADGEFETRSEPIALGAWHSVTTLLEDGMLKLRVDDAVTEVAVTGAVVTAMGPLVIGEGVTGNVDSVKVFDLSRPRILAFADGTDTATVTIGATGEAAVVVRSLGNLRTASPKSWTSELVARIRNNSQGGFYSTRIGALTLEVFIQMVQLVGGFVEGDPDSVAGFIGDIIASFVIYGDIRDIAVALYRHWKSTATAGDYIVLVIAIIGLLTTIFPPADLITAGAKAGAKLLIRLPEPVQRLFGLVIKDVLGGMLSRGRAGLGAAKDKLIDLVKFLAALPRCIDSLVRVSGIIRSADRVWALVRLGARHADPAQLVQRLHRVMDDLPVAEQLRERYAGELLDLMVHQSDAALAAGQAAVRAWSDDAMAGAARFLRLTGEPGHAQKIVDEALRMRTVQNFHAEVAEEFFTAVKKMPEATPDLDGMLGKRIAASANGEDLQGLYGAARMIGEGDLTTSGRLIETVNDLVTSNKQGVDAIVRSGDNLPVPVRARPGGAPSPRAPEFIEIKYVQAVGDAAKKEQIVKHLDSRVAPVLDQLSSAGRSVDEIKDAMNKVRLKYDIILRRTSPPPPTIADANRLKADVMKRLNDVLGLPQYQALRDAGFKFHPEDVLVRLGDPIRQAVGKLDDLVRSQ